MEKGAKVATAIVAVLAAVILAAPGVLATTTESMNEVIDLMWLIIPLMFVFSILGGLMGAMGGMFAFGHKR